MNKNEDTQSIIKAVINYLDCPCRFFESEDNDSDIMESYHEAKERGEKEGFVPVLVSANSTLWECLIMNSDSENDFRGNYDFDAGRVTEYRRQVLSEPLEDGRAVMENMIKQIGECSGSCY